MNFQKKKKEIIDFEIKLILNIINVNFLIKNNEIKKIKILIFSI
jgi:hypothetical protein